MIEEGPAYSFPQGAACCLQLYDEHLYADWLLPCALMAARVCRRLSAACRARRCGAAFNLGARALAPAFQKQLQYRQAQLRFEEQGVV